MEQALKDTWKIWEWEMKIERKHCNNGMVQEEKFGREKIRREIKTKEFSTKETTTTIELIEPVICEIQNCIC